MEDPGSSIHVLVLPFFGQGHIFPSIQLCRHLSSHQCTSIFIIPSHLSSSIPSDLLHHPLIQVIQIPASYSTPPAAGGGSGNGHHHQQLGRGIENFLSERHRNDVPGRIGCVVMDVMMSWSKDIFTNWNIPIVSFFTSGAASAAMEYAAWKARAEDMVPGETRMLFGLPESVALNYSDLQRRDHRTGGGRPLSSLRPGRGMDFGPPRPGQPPRWLEETETGAVIALLINTCDDLERPFLAYLANQMGKPVLGVGPLLPESYWKSGGSNQDRRTRRESSHTEDEVIQWLDSKPAKSVIYVSFGSEVGPTMEEYDELANALRESSTSFIWVIQPGSGKTSPPANFGGSHSQEGYYPKGLDKEVGEKGLIIKGWAPQLVILSHRSTGGFLSHCGWNSTVEAICRGIPILGWPIRGDQYYNARLVVANLRVGLMVSRGKEMVKKDNIIRGIEKLMKDKEVGNGAMVLRGVFEGGYPDSSRASFKRLMDLISIQILPSLQL